MQDLIDGTKSFGFVTQKGNGVYLVFTIEVLLPDFHSEITLSPVIIGSPVLQ